SVTCQYKVAYFYDGSQVDGKWQDDRGEPASAPKSITLVAVFVNDKGGEYSKQETKFGRGSGESTSGTYTITKSAGQGMVLDKTFWVKFSWSETDGNKKISSAEAVCKV
ncbi:MAG: hypothetical protein NTV30_03975, partial [Chloroflexi bacterium]|nr:hypothetical protein [Chloroflexota bacterium]